MFRGLSSWLGLRQPEGPRAREEPPRGDELSAGDAPPEESPEPPAEPTVVEPQPPEEPELSHQDVGLSSESARVPEGGLGGRAGGGAGMLVCEAAGGSSWARGSWVRSRATPALPQAVKSCLRESPQGPGTCGFPAKFVCMGSPGWVKWHRSLRGFDREFGLFNLTT